MDPGLRKSYGSDAKSGPETTKGPLLHYAVVTQGSILIQIQKASQKADPTNFAKNVERNYFVQQKILF